MPAIVWGLLAILSILWGGAFLFIRVAVAEIPTMTLVLARVAIAAAILVPVLWIEGHKLPRDAKSWRDLFVQGLLNNVIPFGLIVWGETTIGAGLASIFNATTPIFAVLVAHLFTSNEKSTGLKVIGCALGFLGVVVLIGVDALSGLANNIWAELACIGAALSYGVSGLWSRRFRGRPPTLTSAGQLTASSLMLLPLALVIDKPWTLPMPSMTALAAVIALAALSTSLAYIIYFRIVTLSGPTAAMLVTFLIPPSAILMGVALLGEHLARQHVAGVLLIGCGLIAIDGRLVRRFLPKRAAGPA